jgi:CRISPR-associated endonuclease/helicase Cas3
MNYPDDFEDSYLSEIKESIQYYKDGEKLRTIYSYVLGILNLADWIASAKFDGKEFDFSQKVEKLELSFELKSFQKTISEITSSALIEIPTGEGKTEASLLWALKNIRNSNSKIIYTLPTQTTSNKLFQRVEKLFDDVGLVHSSAKSYLETIYQNENGGVEWATPYTFTKLFSQPITVSTLDALLKHFVNIGRYPISTLNYINSVVIIDEVHSYDFKFLGFLKRFLEISEKFGVKTLLMSASIPNILKRKLEIENLPTVTDKKLFDKVANRIEKKETLLIDNIDTIISDYKRGKKVLVIVNQVKRAVEIYKALENVENKTLFHSQFKKGDRAKKESEIFEILDRDSPYILVATQIVEISLDIDFEVLYTEIAPIDSLIQRFGRVNRQKDKNRIGDIFIYQTENPKPYEDIPIKYAFETVENGLFPISRYIEWLNIYYEKLLDGDKGFQTEFQDSFKKGYSKFDEILESPISENRDYNLRDIEIPTEDFLLKEDFEKEKIDFNQTIALPSYFSQNYLYAERDSYAKNYWRTLNLKYSYEVGVILEKEDDWSEIW